jgi:hypothetical protein
MRSDLWTKEDTEYLISERRKSPPTEWRILVEKLGRTRQSMRGRLQAVKLRNKVNDLNDLDTNSAEEMVYRSGG